MVQSSSWTLEGGHSGLCSIMVLEGGLLCQACPGVCHTKGHRCVTVRLEPAALVQQKQERERGCSFLMGLYTHPSIHPDGQSVCPPLIWLFIQETITDRWPWAGSPLRAGAEK